MCGLNAALVFDIGPIRILPNVASTIFAGLFHKIGGLEPEGWNCMDELMHRTFMGGGINCRLL